jgi:hypothetical protein
MNRIIRQVSLIGLFMLAVTVGANAQGNQQYRADVPFSFEANGKHYSAGEYTVGPLSQIANPGGIALRNLDTGKARILGVTSNHGDNDWNVPARLIFLKVGGQYTLSQISTATFKMKMKAQKARSAELAKGGSDPEIVAVDLKK